MHASHFKLSNVYFFYFAVFGLFIPYAGLYYEYLGFNALQIGQLSALFVVTKVIAPNLLGWLSDKTGLQMTWVKWSAFLTFASLWLFAEQVSFNGILFSVFLFSIFFHSSLPIFESYTLTSLKSDKASYGKIRLWGSVGFILSVLLVGFLVDKHGLAIFPWLLLFTAVLVWLSSLFLFDFSVTKTATIPHNFISVIKKPHVIALLIVGMLIQFSHGTYYGFYSIFLADAGYSKTAIAWLWTIGVLAEIGVFLWMRKLFSKATAKNLLLLSLALTALRWVLIPLSVESEIGLFFAQLLHAASYGLFHAAAIYLIDESFTGRNKSRGQAVYASSSHGLGGALGLLLAGFAWYNFGAEVAFVISAIAVTIAFFIAYKWVK